MNQTLLEAQRAITKLRDHHKIDNNLLIPLDNLNGPSPWGHITSIQCVDTGIAFCQTESHGGTWLSKERIKELPKDYKPFTDDPHWHEEDLDTAKVLKFLGYDPRNFDKLDGTQKGHEFKVGDKVKIIGDTRTATVSKVEHFEINAYSAITVEITKDGQKLYGEFPNIQVLPL